MFALDKLYSYKSPLTSMTLSSVFILATLNQEISQAIFRIYVQVLLQAVICELEHAFIMQVFKQNFQTLPCPCNGTD